MTETTRGTVDIGHTRLGFEKTGSGPNLLFIHGWPLNSTMWWSQINGLESIARLIAPDLRGFGQSPTTPDKHDIGRYADDLFELLQALGHREPVVLCGMSMGGYVAFEFYRRYPEMVRGLILTATRAKPDDAAGKQNRNDAVQRVREHGVNSITSTLPRKLLATSHVQRSSPLPQPGRTPGQSPDQSLYSHH